MANLAYILRSHTQSHAHDEGVDARRTDSLAENIVLSIVYTMKKCAYTYINVYTFSLLYIYVCMYTLANVVNMAYKIRRCCACIFAWAKPTQPIVSMLYRAANDNVITFMVNINCFRLVTRWNI